jgi:NAD(P)-dependent dehydrogenase (short-subunit alcohol dehydrogenase family)
MTPAESEEILEFGAQTSAKAPLDRFGRANEIASAALVLASDEASYVASVDLYVDGGIVAV